MNCQEFVEGLMAYLDGDLTPEQRRDFERHLAQAPTCQEYLRTYLRSIELSRAACDCPDPGQLAALPESLVKSILANCQRQA